MLAFARALGEFGATLMLAGNIPGQTQTIPMAIYFAVEAGAMNEAWFWAIAIMVISLSGIIAVNFWQELREKGRGQGAGGGGQVVTERSRSGAGGEILYTPQSSFESGGLLVNIEKILPSFDLKVAFTSDEQPLGLLGGSGAGKSMILRCLAGIETPTNGRIVLNDRVLFDSEQGINLPSRDRRIGFLVQNYALFPHLSVAQNIAFGLPKKLSAGSIRVQVEEQLIAMQLQGLGDRYPHQLSGGPTTTGSLSKSISQSTGSIAFR